MNGKLTGLIEVKCHSCKQVNVLHGGDKVEKSDKKFKRLSW